LRSTEEKKSFKKLRKTKQKTNKQKHKRKQINVAYQKKKLRNNKTKNE
jgi:hypothetical protein